MCERSTALVQYRDLCLRAGLKPKPPLELAVAGNGAHDSQSDTRFIDLSRCYVGPKHIAILGQLLCSGAFPLLEVLDLSGNDASSEFVSLLVAAMMTSRVPSLRRIALRESFLSRADGELLLQAMRVSPLVTSIDLHNTGLAPEIADAIIVEAQTHSYSLSVPTDSSPAADSSVKTVAPPVAQSGGNAEWDPTIRHPIAPQMSSGPVRAAAPPIVDDFERLTNAEDLLREEDRLAELADFARYLEDEPLLASPSFGPPPHQNDDSTTSRGEGPSSIGPIAPPVLVGAPAAAQQSDRAVSIDPVPQFASLQDVVSRVIHSAPVAEELEAASYMYVDDEFPPASSSLLSYARPPTSRARDDLLRGAETPTSFTLGGRHVSWRRLTQDPKCLSPRLCTGALTTIVSGQVTADEWLCNAMRVITMSSQYGPAALHEICVKEYPDLGIFCVALRKTDTVIHVIVDDFAPVDHATGDWLCTRSSDPNELWPAIVEKAMAKLHGGYDRLACGSLREGLMDLLGGAATKIVWELHAAKYAIANGDLFDAIRRQVHLQPLGGSLCAAVPRAQNALEKQALTAAGLAPNTSYLVDRLETLTSPPVSLVRLRQPRPELVWRGRFGPHSEQMTDDSIRAALGWSSDLTGRLFWMTFEDFSAFFGNLYTVRWHCASTETLRCYTAHQTLQWLQGQHGGPLDSDPLWTNAPTVGVRVYARNTPVSVHVSLFDQRLKRGQPLAYPCTMQLVILSRSAPEEEAEAATPNRSRVHRDWKLSTELRFKSPVCSTRDLTTEITLQPSTDYYIVVGFTGAKAVRYAVRLTSLGRMASCVVEDEGMPLSLRWEWAAHSAGGAAFNGYFTSTSSPPSRVLASPRAAINPQVLLRLKRSGRVTLLLSRSRKAPPIGIGMVLCRSASALSTVEAITERRVANTDFVEEQSVSLVLPSLDAGVYIVILCTHIPGVEDGFVLHAFSTQPLELKRASL